MTTRLNYLILCVLLIVGIPCYWLFYEHDPGEARPKDISIQQLRALSNEIKGARPETIHYVAVSSFHKPQNFVAAGSGMRPNSLFVLAYRLDFVDRKSILIGSGMTPEQSNLQGYKEYKFSRQAQIVASLKEADHVIPLDDSLGQIGGLEAQVASGKSLDLKQDLENQWRRDLEGKPYAMAPGVVIIPVPNLQNRLRLVYVHLENGNEYLFGGPVAPVLQSWRDLRPPARIVTDKMESHSRQELFSWLMTLQELRRQAPGLTIVSGYRVPTKSGIIRDFAHDYDR